MVKTLKSDATQPRKRNCDVTQEDSTAQSHVGFAHPKIIKLLYFL